MLTQINDWVVKYVTNCKYTNKRNIIYVSKTKIKLYISKQKICLTNEIHGNSFAYKKQMKEESFSTGKPKKNMHKSLYLSMALRIIPK